MAERGSDKHGPALDDQMKQEVQGTVQGSPQPAHTEEWRQTESLDDGEGGTAQSAAADAAEETADQENE